MAKAALQLGSGSPSSRVSGPWNGFQAVGILSGIGPKKKVFIMPQILTHQYLFLHLAYFFQIFI